MTNTRGSPTKKTKATGRASPQVIGMATAQTATQIGETAQTTATRTATASGRTIQKKD